MPKFYRPALSGVVVAALATIAMITPGHAGPPVTNGPPNALNTVRLVDVGSGLCASPAGGSSALNAAVVQYYCDADPTRLWDLVPSRWYDADNPIYQIMDDATRECLSPAGGGVDDRTPMVQYTCDDDPARDWVLSYNSTDVFMSNENSGLCLTVDPGTGANAGLIQSGCDAPQAHWQISSSDTVANTHSGLCLSPTDSRLNTAVVQGACVTSYRISADDSGTLVVRDTGDQLCLSPAGGSTAWNVAVVQYLCDTDPARHWTVARRGGGYEIRNLHSDLCLSPAGGATTTGTTIVQYLCDGDPSRLWTLTPEPTAYLRLGG